jgi:D-alanyl-D-alanine carboxypeptidase/D-alanyl-D-alanine-endopeptidase (penicillin-binding protein 4)
MKSSFRAPLSLILLFVSALSVVAQPVATEKPVETLAQFQARLKAAATHSRYSAAMLGIKVESLDTDKVIFEQHAEKLLKPASNAKMYTGALALDRFGPGHKIRTSFYAASRPDASGRLSGDLIVFGRGDPSLSHRFNDGDYKTAIDQLAGARWHRRATSPRPHHPLRREPSPRGDGRM